MNVTGQLHHETQRMGRAECHAAVGASILPRSRPRTRKRQTAQPYSDQSLRFHVVPLFNGPAVLILQQDSARAHSVR